MPGFARKRRQAAPDKPYRCSWEIIFLYALLLLGAPTAAQASSVFRISLIEPGVYRVTYEDLVAAGLTKEPLSASSLALSNKGASVPLWVEDGGDGRFGPGDWFTFVGQALAGEASYYNEFTSVNTYVLHLRDGQPARMRDIREFASVDPAAARAVPFVIQRWEEDRLLMRFRPQDGAMQELWYWAKLTHLDPQPFTLPLDLSDRLTSSTEPLTLRLHFRGWSYTPRSVVSSFPDHRVEVLFNGVMVGSGEWQGQEEYRLDLQVPAHLLTQTSHTLAVRIPRRKQPQTANARTRRSFIDVVLLNWIEASYPRKAEFQTSQTRFFVSPMPGAAAITFLVRANDQAVVYGQHGTRVALQPSQGVKRGALLRYQVSLPSEEAFFYTVINNQFKAPVAIARDEPSQLRGKNNHADYLMITPAHLRAAIEPLAAFHRRRGLTVSVIDIQDIYDEFNESILHPRAIRDFIAYAYHQWKKPAPRFVLLVGDASWDTKNTETHDANYPDWTYRPGEGRKFRKNKSTAYPLNARLNRRNLIPTWNYNTYEGHAASDNWFVAVDGDKFYPDLAIGRLPVTEPEEVAAIVQKTIDYVENPESGPWRRKSLWITNEDERFQRISDRLSEQMIAQGFTAQKIYPQGEEASNQAHQAVLREAFDQGQFLIHFYGHGGRYIWRTGPPDLRKNYDLFTLDDLDQLAPTRRLPIVLSMTCYTAPFDHPSADSLGEKFLRLPGRGAVAVFAASWRNNPSQQFSEAVLRELTQPGTLGEALMRAKRAVKNRLLVETYNLLGDPALPLPPLELHPNSQNKRR